MAKGLRSRSKLAHRTAKRYSDSSDYKVIEAARLNAITSRLHDGLNRPKLEVYSSSPVESAKKETKTDASQGEKLEAEGGEQDKEDVAMQSEEASPNQAAPKKISTSGPRDNSSTRWKKVKKGKNVKGKGGKTKKGGKR